MDGGACRSGQATGCEPYGLRVAGRAAKGQVGEDREARRTREAPRAQKVKRSERTRWSKLDGISTGSPTERSSGIRVNSSRKSTFISCRAR